MVFMLLLTPGILSLLVHICSAKYDPTWDSLDKRPIPKWYDEAKIGIFIHWGVWSVPGAGFNESAYLWLYLKQNQSLANEYIKKYYPPNFEYPEFAPSFKAEFYSPDKWASVFSSSGAKYIVFVSKHHDGYSMWPSSNSFNWNSMDVGPKRDLLGELVSSVRKNTNLRIGVYYSLFEFFNDLYLSDKESNFTQSKYIEAKMLAQLQDLVETYKPDLIWTDGDWEAYSDYWRSKEFLSWLYSDSPVSDDVVVYDRWGIDALCKHGGVFTCTDRYNPRILNRKHKWENAMTLDLNSWGYRHNFEITDVITIESLLEEIVTTVSCGGNILINVGPTSQGTIHPIFEERFIQMGEWLKVNGEAIYKTSPWIVQNDTLNHNKVWYTSRLSQGNSNLKSGYLEIYAISLLWPSLLSSFREQDFTISLNTSLPCNKIGRIHMLGLDDGLDFICDETDNNVVLINVHTINPFMVKSKWAWTFKIASLIRN